MTTYYEQFDTLALRPATLMRMEPALRQLAADEWEDDSVRGELENLANEIRARLQRIGITDI